MAKYRKFMGPRIKLQILQSRNTWWLDSNITNNNNSVSMRGCLNCWKPNDVERYIYVGDGKSVEMASQWRWKL